MPPRVLCRVLRQFPLLLKMMNLLLMRVEMFLSWNSVSKWGIVVVLSNIAKHRSRQSHNLIPLVTNVILILHHSF